MERKEIYSIRKFKAYGASSALIGIGLAGVALTGQNSVYADEVAPISEGDQPVVEEVVSAEESDVQSDYIETEEVGVDSAIVSAELVDLVSDVEVVDAEEVDAQSDDIETEETVADSVSDSLDVTSDVEVIDTEENVETPESASVTEEVEASSKESSESIEVSVSDSGEKQVARMLAVSVGETLKLSGVYLSEDINKIFYPFSP